MPTFMVRSPTGETYRVTAPEGASEEQAIAYVQQNLTRKESQQGFGQAFSEGFTGIKALPAGLGYTFNRNDETRQAVLDKQASEGARTSWEDVKDVPSFWDWAKQTAGQSAGYMAAPGLAGAVAKGLTKSPGIGKVAGYGLLGAQYLTDIMGRNAEANTEVNLPRAVVGAAGETALDVVGLKFFQPLFGRMPLLRGMFGWAGKEGEAATEGILADAFSKGTVKYSQGIMQGIGKGVAFEIPQEVAQQALERWGAGMPLTDESARKEYGEALAGAALLGGTMGAVSGAIDTADARGEMHEKKRAEAEAIEAKRKAAAEAAKAKGPVVTTEEELKQQAVERSKKDAEAKRLNVPDLAAAEAEEKARVAAAEAAEAAKVKPKVAPTSAVTTESELGVLPDDNEVVLDDFGIPMATKGELRKKAAALNEVKTPAPPPVATGNVTPPPIKTNEAETRKATVENALKVLWKAADEKGVLQSKGSGKVLMDAFGISSHEANKLLNGLEVAGHLTKNPDKSRQLITKPKPEETVTDATNVTPAPTSMPGAAEANDGAVLAGAPVLGESGSTDGAAADADESVGVAASGAATDETAEGAQQGEPALEPRLEPELEQAATQLALDHALEINDARARVRKAATAQKAKPALTAETQPVVPDRTREGPQTSLLSDEDRKKLDAAKNIVAAWQPKRVEEKPAEAVAEPTGDAAMMLKRVEAVRDRIPQRKDGSHIIDTNRLNTIAKNIRAGKPLTEKDTSDIDRINKKWKAPPPEKVPEVKFEPGKPDDAIKNILHGEETKGQERTEYDSKGEPKTYKLPSKVESLLKRISATGDGMLGKLADTLLNFSEEVVNTKGGTAKSDKTVRSEAELDPEGLKRIKPVIGHRAATAMHPSHPYLSRKRFDMQDEESHRIGLMNFKVVNEGQEKTDEDRKFIEKMKKNGNAGAYRATTNTFYFTNEGMNAKTVMHEMVHAFTVKVLRQYEVDPLALTDIQLDGVKRIEGIFRAASRTSMKTQFPAAFENIYEFVSYAMTEPEMQAELKRSKIVPAATAFLDSKRSPSKVREFANKMWNSFTYAVARTLGFGPDGVKSSTLAGNAMLELSEALSDIMSIPKAITGQKAPTLFKKASPTRARADDRVDLTNDQLITWKDEKLEEKHDRTRTIRDTAQYLSSWEGVEMLIHKFQNDRRKAKVLEDNLELAGELISSGDKRNDLNTALTLSSQKAHFAMQRVMAAPMAATNEAVRAFAEIMGMGTRQALSQLDNFLVMLHEPERRAIKFLKNVPLNNVTPVSIPGLKGTRTAAKWREHIFEDMLSKGEMEGRTEEDLRHVMDQLAAKYADATGYSPMQPDMDLRADKTLLDPSHQVYDVIGYTEKTLADIRRVYNETRKKAGKEIDAVIDAVQAMHEATKDLSKQAHYWSEPVDRVTKFYGWKHYVPFKGKPQFEDNEEYDRFVSSSAGGHEFVEAQESFGGRKSDAENAILQTMVDGAKSALRLGRVDVALTIKNLIEQGHIHGKTSVKVTTNAKGERVETPRPEQLIKFEQRYKEFEKEGVIDENTVLRYLDDGTIEVIKIGTDPFSRSIREAVRRAYREPAPILHALNSLTGFMGHMHTRYNPAFAPYNFIRDMMTNSFNLSATFGGARAADYASTMAKQVATGGMNTTRKIAWLYANSRISEIEALLKSEGPNSFAADVYQFLKVGGRVAYIQGISSKATLDSLLSSSGESEFSRRKAAFDKYMDTWSDTFELTSRAAAFAALKREYEGKRMDPKAAAEKAAAEAKNLANFEQIGTRGREAGALFMFFRPAATGAVAALDAIRPFLMSEEAFTRSLPDSIRTNPERKAKALENYRLRSNHARLTLAALGGAGFMVYMMALLAGQGGGEDGDDPLLDKRNPVLTDDPALWTRNIRLPLKLLGMGGANEKDFLQMPWGFGLGAASAMGAQLAAWSVGTQNFRDMIGNMSNISLDSFIPLPISRINPTTNFSGWLIDSLMPSMARPLVQYQTNTDGLGRAIYNDNITKYADAMLGGQNVPESYHATSKWLMELTNGDVDIHPNTLYFWVNNYFDGAARVSQSLYGLGLAVSGEKDFDLKTDALLLSSFIGRKSNIDAREFTSVENQINEMGRKLKMFENDPEQLNRYKSRYPQAEGLVYMMNQFKGGDLKGIRAALNEVRASKGTTLRQRKEAIDALNRLQNYYKRQMLDYFALYGMTP